MSHRPRFRQALTVGITFGVVEAITPLVGWLLGAAASQYVTAYTTPKVMPTVSAWRNRGRCDMQAPRASAAAKASADMANPRATTERILMGWEMVAVGPEQCPAHPTGICTAHRSSVSPDPPVTGRVAFATGPVGTIRCHTTG